MHRDIKPSNLLIDPTCHVLKICDFGSAKRYHAEDESIPYITSRYYRAPELIFGRKNYDYTIDIWSAGCVMAEMVIGKPLFKGDNAVAYLIEVIKKMGTPSEYELNSMNPDYAKRELPKVVGSGLAEPLHASNEKVDPAIIDLIEKMIVYTPKRRIGLYEAMCHPYFDELRQRDLMLPNGNCMPDLFNFSAQEQQFMGGNCKDVLVPGWYDPLTSPCVHVV